MYESKEAWMIGVEMTTELFEGLGMEAIMNFIPDGAKVNLM